MPHVRMPRSTIWVYFVSSRVHFPLLSGSTTLVVVNMKEKHITSVLYVLKTDQLIRLVLNTPSEVVATLLSHRSIHISPELFIQGQPYKYVQVQNFLY